MLGYQRTLLDNLLAVPISKSGWRGLTFMASLFLSEDYLKQKGSLVAAFSRTAYSLKHFSAIHDFTESVNRIDDTLDSMTGEETLDLGEVRYGPELCEFLQNPKLDPGLYLKTMDRLVDLGLTDRATAIAFSNIFAVMVHDRACHMIEAQKSRSAEARAHMAALNVRVTQAYTVFIYRCFNHYKNDCGDLSDFGCMRALRPYPDIARLALLGQIMDDTRDFFLDLQDEMDTGIASPNWLIAEIAKQGDLTVRGGKLHPELRSYIRWNRDREDPLSFEESLPSIKKAVTTVAGALDHTSLLIKGETARTIARSCFYNSIVEGFKTSRHPDIVRKKEKEQRQEADLLMRMGYCQ